MRGPALGLLALLWLLARTFFLLPGEAAFLAAFAAEMMFFALAIACMARSVWRSRSQHNYGFPLLLLGIALADAAFLGTLWRGADYFRLMQPVLAGMLLMLAMALLLARRVIPFFASRAIAGLTLTRHTRSGQLQLALMVLAIAAWGLQWMRLAAAGLAAAGLIALWHLLAWKPWAVLRTPLLWILYLGYCGMALGLFAAALYLHGRITQLSVPIHLIAVAGFAPLILGMMTRTALGHTGRLLRTDRTMTASFIALLPCLILRLLALHGGSHSLLWLHASAAFWLLAFTLYLYRFAPILTRARIDKQPGKPVALRPT